MIPAVIKIDLWNLNERETENIFEAKKHRFHDTQRRL